MNEPKCHHAGHAAATGLWYFPEGCLCFSDKIQFLCTQHALKAENNGIRMTRLADLSVIGSASVFQTDGVGSSPTVRSSD